eukprot:TRINITY_DN1923_c0_g1_i1.p1 TRINITY_DN1923_c0_g1~~TRINITY_DN1923_c0_g1_i1.p1  ORF type:complete len:420 (-),score=70.65 TRINITY_DN1923_c0_g1_i1:26-1252(-)
MASRAAGFTTNCGMSRWVDPRSRYGLFVTHAHITRPTFTTLRTTSQPRRLLSVLPMPRFHVPLYRPHTTATPSYARAYGAASGQPPTNPIVAKAQSAQTASDKAPTVSSSGTGKEQAEFSFAPGNDNASTSEVGGKQTRSNAVSSRDNTTNDDRAFHTGNSAGKERAESSTASGSDNINDGDTTAEEIPEVEEVRTYRMHPLAAFMLGLLPVLILGLSIPEMYRRKLKLLEDDTTSVNMMGILGEVFNELAQRLMTDEVLFKRLGRSMIEPRNVKVGWTRNGAWIVFPIAGPKGVVVVTVTMMRVRHENPAVTVKEPHFWIVANVDMDFGTEKWAYPVPAGMDQPWDIFKLNERVEAAMIKQIREQEEMMERQRKEQQQLRRRKQEAMAASQQQQQQQLPPPPQQQRS